MPQLKFYDLKKKKSFITDKYVFKSKKTKRGMTYFAVSKAPSGIPSYRIVGKEFYRKYK